MENFKLVKYPIQYFIIFLNHILNKKDIKNDDLKKKLEIFEDDDTFIEYCYFFKQIIHEILRENEAYININPKKHKFSYFIYLAKLTYNVGIVDYIYDYKLIKELNEENNDEKNELRKFINSTIIIILLTNYLNNSDGMEDELNNIKNINIEIIKNYLIEHKEIELTELNKHYENISINSIYLVFIKHLIETLKKEDYVHANQILRELDLENVFIIDSIIDKLSPYLNEQLNIKEYQITKIEDFTGKKINFYYILFKYIFKETYFIANISILLSIRKIIIKAIKEKDNNLFLKLDDNDLKKKKDYILKRILDCDYYYDKYIYIIDEKLNKLINYYENNNPEKKEETIKIREDIKKNKNVYFSNFSDEIYEDFMNVKNLEIKAQEKGALKPKKIQNDIDSNADYLYKNNIKGKEKNCEKSTKEKTSEEKGDYGINNYYSRNEIVLLIDSIFNESNYTIIYDKKSNESFSPSLKDLYIKSINSKLGSKYNTILEYIKKNPEKSESINFQKFMEFINKVMNIIKLEEIIEINFELKFGKVVENNNINTNDISPNIYCLYKVSYDNEKFYRTYKENNILKYGTKSDSLGLDTMIFEINNYIKFKIFKNQFNNWNELEKRIKNKKIKNITKENKQKLLENFLDENNKEILLDIFNIEEINYFINENLIKPLKEILKYYNDYFPKSKNNDIKLIEQLIKLKKWDVGVVKKIKY